MLLAHTGSMGDVRHRDRVAPRQHRQSRQSRQSSLACIQSRAFVDGVASMLLAHTGFMGDVRHRDRVAPQQHRQSGLACGRGPDHASRHARPWAPVNGHPVTRNAKVQGVTVAPTAFEYADF